MASRSPVRALAAVGWNVLYASAIILPVVAWGWLGAPIALANTATLTFLGAGIKRLQARSAAIEREYADFAEQNRAANLVGLTAFRAVMDHPAMPEHARDQIRAHIASVERLISEAPDA